MVIIFHVVFNCAHIVVIDSVLNVFHILVSDGETCLTETFREFINRVLTSILNAVVDAVENFPEVFLCFFTINLG